MRDDGSEDLWAASAISARLIAGWACAAVAVLDLSMGLGPRPYLIFHAMLLAGGLLLLTMGNLPKKPSPIGYAVTAALALLALVLAALPRTSTVCCMRGLAIRHGYPLTVLAWDDGQKRHFAPGHAVADLVFWFLAGLIVLAAVTQALPRREPAPAASTVPTATAVPTAAAAPTATVGSAATAVSAATAGPALTAGPGAAGAEAGAFGPTATAKPAVTAIPSASSASAASTAASPAEVAAGGGPGRRSTHAEERAGADGGHARAADDESVGGLP